MKTKKLVLKLPKDLVDEMDKKCKKGGFNSITNYVIYVLRQTLVGSSDDHSVVFSKDEEKEIEEKIRKMGYL